LFLAKDVAEHIDLHRLTRLEKLAGMWQLLYYYFYWRKKENILFLKKMFVFLNRFIMIQDIFVGKTKKQ